MQSSKDYEEMPDYTEKGLKEVIASVRTRKRRKVLFIIGEGRTKSVEVTKKINDD